MARPAALEPPALPSPEAVPAPMVSRKRVRLIEERPRAPIVE
jgi:hypothetical protein